MTDRSLPKRLSRLFGSFAFGPLFALALAGAVLPAVAQVPAPAQRGDKVLPPIEILAELVGDSVRCSPAEVRLPAQDEIDLRLVNRSDQPLTFAGQEIFSDRYLVRLEGDVVHAASDQGYVVKPNATGRIILRTPPAGQYRYTCASSRTQGNPTGGTLTVVASQ